MLVNTFVLCTITEFNYWVYYRANQPFIRVVFRAKMHFKGVTNQTEETENATSNQNHDGVTDPFQTAQALRSAVVFQSCVIAIGFIGALANGLVIWILTRSTFNKDRKASNTFMLNQLFLDLCSCLLLMLSCIWKLAGARLQGRLNMVLCFLIGSENLQWTCINSSIANLVFIALERVRQNCSFHMA